MALVWQFPIGRLLLLLAIAGAQLDEGEALIETLNVDTNFKQVLSTLFDNNIELTRMTIAMVDSIPSDRRNRQHAFNFIKAHYSNNVNVQLDVGRTKTVPLSDFMNSSVSPTRVVLAMFLMTLINKPVSSAPPEFVGPNNTVSYDICAQMAPKTFLNRCPSPCEPCEKYPEIRPTISNSTIRSRFEHRPAETGRDAPQMPKSWFFDEAQLRQFQKIIDGSDFHLGDTKIANNFDRFLITIPQVTATQLAAGYFENMLALVASLGIPMSSERYERFRTPPETATEVGFLALISRLTLLARQFRPRMRNKHCQLHFYCQLEACRLDGILVRSSTGRSLRRKHNDVTCLWCSH